MIKQYVPLFHAAFVRAKILEWNVLFRTADMVVMVTNSIKKKNQLMVNQPNNLT